MLRRKQKNIRKTIKILLLWLAFLGYVIILEPSTVFSFAGFYFLLAAALFFTFQTFLGIGRNLIWSAVIILYLLLRQFRLDNILNTAILAGILVTLEIYFRKT